MESDGHGCTTPCSVPSRPITFRQVLAEESGPTSSGYGLVYRVRFDARIDILLPWAIETHVGSHVVLRPPRRVGWVGGVGEKGGEGKIPAAGGGFRAVGVGFGGGDELLAILSAVLAVRNGTPVV